MSAPAGSLLRALLQMAMDANVFEQVLRRWIEQVSPEVSDDELSAISLDGKTLCGASADHGRAVQLLSLLDQRTGCVLSQPATRTKPKPRFRF